MILEIGLDEAWAALSQLPPTRDHGGTARLEEVDDDTHTATLRLTGTVMATVTATLEAVEAGTRLHVATRAHPAPDAATIREIVARLAAAIAPTPPPAPSPPPQRGRLVSAAFHRMRRHP